MKVFVQRTIRARCNFWFYEILQMLVSSSSCWIGKSLNEEKLNVRRVSEKFWYRPLSQNLNKHFFPEGFVSRGKKYFNILSYLLWNTGRKFELLSQTIIWPEVMLPLMKRKLSVLLMHFGLFHRSYAKNYQN